MNVSGSAVRTRAAWIVRASTFLSFMIATLPVHHRVGHDLLRVWRMVLEKGKGGNDEFGIAQASNLSVITAMSITLAVE